MDDMFDLDPFADDYDGGAEDDPFVDDDDEIGIPNYQSRNSKSAS